MTPEQVTFNEVMMTFDLYWTNTISWIFILLVQRDNSPRVDMSLHSDIQSLLAFLKDACLS